MQHSDFVHLHVHTQYSLLDGTNRLGDLFKKAKEFKMPALAITDHGNIFGAVDFYQSAYKYGVKPIIGCEVYLAPGSRTDKSAGQNESAKHLILLVKNAIGFQNLIKLSSLGYLEGFYYRPRIDKEILSRYHEGLIALSACLHGEIPALLMRRDKEAARERAIQYREIFGEGNFYLELMVNGIPEQESVNEGLIELSRELSLPVVATNDCHYLARSDAEAHEVLLCIQTGKTMNDEDRLRFSTDQFYLRSPDEMKLLFKDIPEAIDNTIVIAEKCNLKIDTGKFYLPNYDPPDGITLEENLTALAQQGLQDLLPLISQTTKTFDQAAYEERLRTELEIIKAMGFAGYFLIVSDFVNYARSKKIPVGPGRGSAAGSLVAYVLRITNIDPIRYGLFFERFLNPDRISMPDIDIDFCQEGREEVIKYVTEKYGQDRVAQIITFGKMQARAVIRDVGRALGIPYSEVDAIAKLIPNVLNITLDEALKMEPRLLEEERKNERIKKLLQLSRSLEGLIRHSSTHAAGVVISDVPLLERVPLSRSPKNEVVTQYSMKDLQETGMTKFDFLGLKTLTVIKNAISYIREQHSRELVIDNIPLDDQKTFALLHRAETDGVFQLESSGMKDILVKMKPDTIEDIIAQISLYRPGPMKMVPEFIARKHGKTEVTYEVPILKEIISETYGVILYQEQVMQIASAIGGYSLADADNLRKVMSKKKTAEMEREKPKFLEGAKKKNIREDKAKKIWEQMETFAEYGFNKSHSTAYAVISYQTAYLKAHYPVEFMAALLTSERDNRDNIIKYINSAKEMGIAILPPDINESMSDFSISHQNIRFGLSAVKHVGAAAVEIIIASREEGGKFKSFTDFCRRVDLRKVNKRVLESLIKCGSFDLTGHKRSQLIIIYEEVLAQLQRRGKGNDWQGNLLDALDSTQDDVCHDVSVTIPDIPEWDHKELLGYEKETLGFYVTGHPLMRFAERLPFITNVDSSCIRERKDKETVSFAGMISGIREVTTKRKDKMAYATIEDMQGTIETIIFPDVYKKVYPILRQEEPLVILGTLDVGEEGMKVIVNDVTIISNAVEQAFNSVHFILDLKSYEPAVFDDLAELSARHQGKYEAYVHLLDDKTETVVFLGRDAKFEISGDFKNEAERLFGAGSIRFH
ncbi:MAG: DNA polymerase III subunit alpha [Smithellaceae bacterium]|nr:DNA polymerase III subunit alpha [Smithellaceae bacterium]